MKNATIKTINSLQAIMEKARELHEENHSWDDAENDFLIISKELPSLHQEIKEIIKGFRGIAPARFPKDDEIESLRTANGFDSLCGGIILEIISLEKILHPEPEKEEKPLTINLSRIRANERLWTERLNTDDMLRICEAAASAGDTIVIDDFRIGFWDYDPELYEENWNIIIRNNEEEKLPIKDAYHG